MAKIGGTIQDSEVHVSDLATTPPSVKLLIVSNAVTTEVQYTYVPSLLMCVKFFVLYIRESVDSLCRDDADMPRPPYIRNAYNCPNTAVVSLFR